MKIFAKSSYAKRANRLVESLQSYFISRLNSLSSKYGEQHPFEAIEWYRDHGIHGGGIRYEARDETLFNRGSVNVSQVHYDEDETKRLSSATAISTIIHPQSPHAPSMHMHISWTEMRDGKGYWRIMGDLNPSLPNRAFQESFEQMLQRVAGSHYQEGATQGDQYFYIPVLKRTRGVSHFYLEDFNSGDFEVDYNFADRMGRAIIESYIEITSEAVEGFKEATEEERSIQLAYHTLYLFQVLTLDRGTTSGLLIHDQNDIGIMGSIPAYVDRELLVSWIEKMPPPQESLLRGIIGVLPDTVPTPVETETKKALANVVRAHYTAYPEALSMQASGTYTPPTVENHN